MSREIMQTEPMPDKAEPPKPGDIFYHIVGGKTGLTAVGIAYRVLDPPTKAIAIATAVSGTPQKVRAMLKAKVKKLEAAKK